VQGSIKPVSKKNAVGKTVPYLHKLAEMAPKWKRPPQKQYLSNNASSGSRSNPSLSLTGDAWETFMEGENPTAGPKILE
jgi:hypothetical protein